MQIYEEITPQEREEERGAEIVRSVRKSRMSVVSVQAVLCLLILAAALFLRMLVPALYEELREKYDAEMERSILITYDDVSNP